MQFIVTFDDVFVNYFSLCQPGLSAEIKFNL